MLYDLKYLNICKILDSLRRTSILRYIRTTTITELISDRVENHRNKIEQNLIILMVHAKVCINKIQ